MAKHEPKIVTLLTDFGTTGPYVAAMKGVILSICPEATIVDITHDVRPHDVWGASFVLAEAVGEFPPETVHVVVVDPGVGTQRSALAARFGEQTFVCPDNGVISFVQQRQPLRSLHSIRNRQYIREQPSMTFHGRDVFAPAGAHLAAGVDVSRLGPEPNRYTLLEIPLPREDDGALVGSVLYVDAFGNCVSNIPLGLIRNVFGDVGTGEVWCGSHRVGPIEGTYGFVEPRRPLALINSMGLLEVAVNQASAAAQFGAAVGTQIRIVPARPGADAGGEGP